MSSAMMILLVRYTLRLCATKRPRPTRFGSRRTQPLLVSLTLIFNDRTMRIGVGVGQSCTRERNFVLMSPCLGSFELAKDVRRSRLISAVAALICAVPSWRCVFDDSSRRCDTIQAQRRRPTPSLESQSSLISSAERSHSNSAHESRRAHSLLADLSSKTAADEQAAGPVHHPSPLTWPAHDRDPAQY